MATEAAGPATTILHCMEAASKTAVGKVKREALAEGLAVIWSRHRGLGLERGHGKGLGLNRARLPPQNIL